MAYCVGKEKAKEKDHKFDLILVSSVDAPIHRIGNFAMWTRDSSFGKCVRYFGASSISDLFAIDTG
jgi:hypothetical protein